MKCVLVQFLTVLQDSILRCLELGLKVSFSKTHKVTYRIKLKKGILFWHKLCSVFIHLFSDI